MVDLTKDTHKIPEPPKLALGKYRHYKGKEYEVLGIGTHTETLEFFVVYKPLYEKSGSDLWVRPYSMFIESVVIDGKTIPRFQKISN